MEKPKNGQIHFVITVVHPLGGGPHGLAYYLLIIDCNSCNFAPVQNTCRDERWAGM